MATMISRVTLISALSASVLLTACGGSSGDSSDNKVLSYTGKTTPALFDGLTEAQQLSLLVDSADVLESAGDDLISGPGAATNLPLAVAVEQTANPAELQQLSNRILTLAAQYQAPAPLNAPVAAAGISEGTSSCGESGSRTIQTSGSESSGQISITFNKCKEWYAEDPNDYEELNGRVVLQYSENSILLTYYNFASTDAYEGIVSTFTVNGYYKVTGFGWGDTPEGQAYTAEWSGTTTFDGKSFSSSGTLSCTSAGECTYGSVVTAVSGKIVKVEALEAEETGIGMHVSATLYHQDHGQYSAEATMNSLCNDGDASPFVGTVTLTTTDGTLFYTSDSCTVAPTITFTPASDI